MAKIRYTITSTTKRCPRCGEVIEEKSSNTLIPTLLGALFFYIAIPIFIILFALDAPSIPKLGTNVVTCPNCFLPVCTYSKTWADLRAYERVAYRFRIWIYVCYVLGAIWGICSFGLLTGAPIVSWWGLTWLLSLAGVLAIIITYRVAQAKAE